jgi:hypothetical protein
VFGTHSKLLNALWQVRQPLGSATLVAVVQPSHLGYGDDLPLPLDFAVVRSVFLQS